MATKIILAILWCLATLCSNHADAADQKDLETDLLKIYQNKLLSLKHPCFGSKLEFDSSGAMITKAVEGPWSTSGLLQVENLVLTPEHVEINGLRVILALRTKVMDKHIPVLPSDVGVTPVVTAEHVQIVVELSATDVPQVNSAISRVFQGGQLMDRVAAYWQPKTLDTKAFRQSTPNGVFGELEGNRPVYLVYSGRTGAPKPTDMPDPTYTDAARRKGTEGTVVLWVVVNEKGFPEVLEVAKSLGEDLDAQAITCIAHWKFKPAIRDHQAVAVAIDVGIIFRL